MVMIKFLLESYYYKILLLEFTENPIFNTLIFFRLYLEAIKII